MRLFSGSSHPSLAKALATELGVALGKIELKRFASGECYVRYGEPLRGEDVCIVQAMGQRPDEGLFELLLLCQAAKLAGAAHIRVVVPYLPYARQDRISEPHEAISARLVADMIQQAGATHVITLHLHSEQLRGFFSVPVDALDPAPMFASYVRDRIDHPIVVSPDIGGAKQAKKFADALGAELAILHKIRPGHHEATVSHVVGDVRGKRCILFDDLIDTAGTLCAAKETLLAHGADPRITVVATHGLFSGPADERLREAAFDEIIVTDSIPHSSTLPRLTVLPIAPMLAELVRSIARGA